jgi:hypothetical protein
LEVKVAGRIKKSERFNKATQRLYCMAAAANYLQIGENSFHDRFVKTNKIPVVILDDKESDPLYDIDDLDEHISKNKKWWDSEKAKYI